MLYSRSVQRRLALQQGQPMPEPTITYNAEPNSPEVTLTPETYERWKATYETWSEVADFAQRRANALGKTVTIYATDGATVLLMVRPSA